MFDHRRFHQARQDRIDPDMFRREFDRGGARHLVHRGLGGGVADIGNAEMADRGDRRDVDDRAAALPLHHRNDVLHGEERALQVDREHAVPVRLRHLDHAAHFGDADIVVEHVDAAIGLEARRDHGFDVAGLADIGGERAALPPSDRMMAAVSSAAAPLRSTQSTCAPSRAKVTAVALPLPQPGPIEPAPTTIAVLPLSRGIELLPSDYCIL